MSPSRHTELVGAGSKNTIDGDMACGGHIGQQWSGRWMGLVQASGRQDTEEQSARPTSQVQVTHGSLFQVSPSLWCTPSSSVHPAGLLIAGGKIATGRGGQTGQHCPSGMYHRLSLHHTSEHVTSSQGWRLASKQRKGQRRCGG